MRGSRPPKPPSASEESPICRLFAPMPVFAPSALALGCLFPSLRRADEPGRADATHRLRRRELDGRMAPRGRCAATPGCGPAARPGPDPLFDGGRPRPRLDGRPAPHLPGPVAGRTRADSSGQQITQICLRYPGVNYVGPAAPPGAAARPAPSSARWPQRESGNAAAASTGRTQALFVLRTSRRPAWPRSRAVSPQGPIELLAIEQGAGQAGPARRP